MMHSRCPTLLSGRSNRLSALVHLGTETDSQAAGGQSRHDRRTACRDSATQHQISTRGAERAAGWVTDSEGNEASAWISTLSEEERWDKTACRMLAAAKGCWAKGPLLHFWLSRPAPVFAAILPFDRGPFEASIFGKKNCGPASSHPGPFVGVSQSQFFRDVVNFWR